jgi:hypothetical protein
MADTRGYVPSEVPLVEGVSVPSTKAGSGGLGAEPLATTELSAIITRADGTIEDLGVIAAEYLDKDKQKWWDFVGKFKAEQRVHGANKKFKDIEEKP